MFLSVDASSEVVSYRLAFGTLRNSATTTKSRGLPFELMGFYSDLMGFYSDLMGFL